MLPTWSGQVGDLLKVLSTQPAGGWIFASLVLALVLGLTIRALVIGQLAPGKWVDTQHEQLETLIPGVNGLATSQEELLDLMKQLTSKIEQVQQQQSQLLLALMLRPGGQPPPSSPSDHSS